MKKSLLLGASMLAVMAANAADPAVYKDAQFYAVSHNGQYLAGYFNETFTFVNRLTGEQLNISSDEAGEVFVPGNISPISDLGVLVGTTSYYYGNAAYMINGVVTELNSPYSDMRSLANSISANGQIIVGSVGTAVMSMEDTDIPMQIPAVWELQSDGTYSDAVLLPYPAKDFSGRVPQYVTALVVNEDGTVVLGQVQDYSGMIIQNIKYTKDEEGNWSYATIDDDLINPNHLEFPEFPGDGPTYVAVESFMTEEEIAACEEAQEAWYEENYESGVWDYTTYPAYEDYMTDEEKAAYEAAYNAYVEEYNAWSAKYSAFMDVFYTISASCPAFQFNNMTMSGNGKYVATTSSVAVDDPTSWFGYTEYSAPALIDVETGDITIYNHEPNVHVTTILDDGTMLGSTYDDIYYTYIDGYAWKLGENTPVEYVDYLAGINAESAAWVKENCLHEIDTYVYNEEEESWDSVTAEVQVLGLTKASTDKSTFINYCAVLWDDEDGSEVNSYVYDGANESGVNNTLVGSFSMKALKGGKVYISSDVENLTVVDMSGNVLFSASAPAGVLDLGLSNGAYIIKATANGGSKVVKAIF